MNRYILLPSRVKDSKFQELLEKEKLIDKQIERIQAPKKTANFFKSEGDVRCLLVLFIAACFTPSQYKAIENSDIKYPNIPKNNFFFNKSFAFKQADMIYNSDNGL